MQITLMHNPKAGSSKHDAEYLVRLLEKSEKKLPKLLLNLARLSEMFNSVAKEVTSLSLESKPVELAQAFQKLRMLEAENIEAGISAEELPMLAELLSKDLMGMEKFQERIAHLAPMVSAHIGRFESGIRRLSEDIALIYSQRLEEQQRKFQNTMEFIGAVVAILLGIFTTYSIFLQ